MRETLEDRDDESSDSGIEDEWGDCVLCDVCLQDPRNQLESLLREDKEKPVCCRNEINGVRCTGTRTINTAFCNDENCGGNVMVCFICTIINAKNTEAYTQRLNEIKNAYNGPYFSGVYRVLSKLWEGVPEPVPGMPRILQGDEALTQACKIGRKWCACDHRPYLCECAVAEVMKREKQRIDQCLKEKKWQVGGCNCMNCEHGITSTWPNSSKKRKAINLTESAPLAKIRNIIEID